MNWRGRVWRTGANCKVAGGVLWIISPIMRPCTEKPHRTITTNWKRKGENILTAARGLPSKMGIKGTFTRQECYRPRCGKFLRIRGYWDDYEFVSANWLHFSRPGSKTMQRRLLGAHPASAMIRRKRGELAEARNLFEENLALAEVGS